MSRRSQKYKSIFLATVALASFTFAEIANADNRCRDILKAPRVNARPMPLGLPLRRTKSTYNQNSDYYDLLAKKIELNRDKFAFILGQVDSFSGAEFEITQAIKTLRGVRLQQLDDLKDIHALERVSVFGPENLPLLNLVLHALIPVSTGAEVYFHAPTSAYTAYRQLLGLIRTLVTEYDLTAIHLVTDANFLVDYAAKSDMIIYSGDQRKSDQTINTLVERMKRSSWQTIDKTVFLKFGLGLNPVFVTEDGEKQVSAAVDAAVQAIQINSSKDAIAPKFYAVAEDNIDRFVNLLKRKLTTANFDAATEDSPALAEFRNKWSKYLVTQDPSSKSPSVFVFPYSKFKEVDILEEHAPFLVVFRYNNEKQLEEIASDPRVRSRALFASIFSDPANLDLYELKKMFENNFHSVILNQSAFATADGNLAFGGYGGDVSSSTLLTRAGDQVQLATIARPLLFSREAKENFGKQRSSAPYAQLGSAPADSESVSKLNQLIADASDPKTGRVLPGQWGDLKSPEFTLRQTSLANLRAYAQKGLSIAINAKRPTDTRKINQLNFLYGARLLYADDPPNWRVPGLVLHFTPTDAEVPIFNRFRGELNPHLGFGYLRKLLESKNSEYALANAIWPGSMPGSTRLEQLRDQPQYSQLELSRQYLLTRLNRFAKSENALTPTEKNELIDAVTAHVQIFFDIANAQYTQGAFIKNYEEVMTGDLGNQITTYTESARSYATQFIDRLVIGRRTGDRGNFSSKAFIAYIKKTGYYETGSKMITKLLTNPSDLIIQQRVRIARTEFGSPLEFRIDFLDGVAINVTPRYSREYLAAESEEAAEVLNRFFAQAPAQVKILSGGADLVKLENGEWVFMELNVGSESAFIDPSTSPIDGNLYISKLLGRQTPLIEWLEQTYSQGLRAQRRVLSSRKNESDTAYDKDSVNDLALSEIALYFRDRYLDDWRKNPTAKNAEQTIEQLRSLFKGIGGKNNRDLPQLLKGAENYLNRQLEKK